MALSTVSTYATVQATLNNVNKVESQLTEQQTQLSSGNKSTDFAGLNNDTEQYLSTQNILSKTNQYLDDNKIVQTRIDTTNTALTQITTTATSLQNLISQRLSGTSNSASFDTQLQGFWQQISTQLNSTVNNQYVFSGTKTNTPAVDGSSFPATQVPGVPDDSYYQGSQQDISARAEDNTVLTYNVRADNPGIQKIAAGLALARQGNAQGGTTDQLTQAENLVQKGLQDVISAQATLNATSSQFDTINTSLNNQKLYWQGVQESIGNTDILSVSTQVSVNQGILQAAFQTFARITSLHLSDYLK